MPILRYKGGDAYMDSLPPVPRFIAETGDLVDFSEEEAASKLGSESDLWEVTSNGTQRKRGSGIRTD